MSEQVYSKNGIRWQKISKQDNDTLMADKSWPPLTLLHTDNDDKIRWNTQHMSIFSLPTTQNFRLSGLFAYRDTYFSSCVRSPCPCPWTCPNLPQSGIKLFESCFTLAECNLAAICVQFITYKVLHWLPLWFLCIRYATVVLNLRNSSNFVIRLL